LITTDTPGQRDQHQQRSGRPYLLTLYVACYTHLWDNMAGKLMPSKLEHASAWYPETMIIV